MVPTSPPSSQARDTLKSFLLDALKREARGKRDFELSLLRSQPKRCTSLFAWASDLNVKIYIEHLLVVLAEKRPAPEGEQARFVEKATRSSIYAPDGLKHHEQRVKRFFSCRNGRLCTHIRAGSCSIYHPKHFHLPHLYLKSRHDRHLSYSCAFSRYHYCILAVSPPTSAASGKKPQTTHLCSLARPVSVSGECGQQGKARTG